MKLRARQRRGCFHQICYTQTFVGRRAAHNGQDVVPVPVASINYVAISALFGPR